MGLIVVEWGFIMVHEMMSVTIKRINVLSGWVYSGETNLVSQEFHVRLDHLSRWG